MLIEAAVETRDAALAAARGGAHRIELCADLAHGGTTPEIEPLPLAIPVFVLIRPRTGDFVYTAAEHRTMLEQIRRAKHAGAHGIVTGALTAAGDIDQLRTAELVAATRPLPVTFHRAFDDCRAQAAALETLISLGVERVLTSGGAETAAAGAEQIAKLVKQAQGRITILAGGGVAADNVRQLVRVSGVTEIHFSVKDSEKVRHVLRALKESQ